MMYGRGYFDSFRSNGYGCPGFGLMNNNWLTIILTILLITLAVALIIKLIQNNKSKTVSSVALDNLKAKFANGDISEEEYLKRKNILENK